MVYGKWRKTHPILVWMGFPKYYRNVYASGMIGGGWDGIEWSNTTV